LKACLLSSAGQEKVQELEREVEEKRKQGKKSEFEAKIPKYQPIFK